MNTEQAPSRIPTLDGWRGIAILLVLFDHTMNVFRGYGASPWVQTGQHGVTLFFVLSGFLITSSLLNGPIDLRSFYIRRIFRLMPVAWAYLGLLLLLNLRVHVVSKSAVLASLFFYRNFEAATFGSATWHFWSLSLEEQFYLVWPIVLLLAGARRSRWIAVARNQCMRPLSIRILEPLQPGALQLPDSGSCRCFACRLPDGSLSARPQASLAH